MRELLPRMSRVLVLSYLTDPVAAPQVKALEETARSLGMKLLLREIRTPDDFPAAFDAGSRNASKESLLQLRPYLLLIVSAWPSWRFATSYRVRTI